MRIVWRLSGACVRTSPPARTPRGCVAVGADAGGGSCRGGARAPSPPGRLGTGAGRPHRLRLLSPRSACTRASFATASGTRSVSGRCKPPRPPRTDGDASARRLLCRERRGGAVGRSADQPFRWPRLFRRPLPFSRLLRHSDSSPIRSPVTFSLRRLVLLKKQRERSRREQGRFDWNRRRGAASIRPRKRVFERRGLQTESSVRTGTRTKRAFARGIGRRGHAGKQMKKLGQSSGSEANEMSPRKRARAMEDRGRTNEMRRRERTPRACDGGDGGAGAYADEERGDRQGRRSVESRCRRGW